MAKYRKKPVVIEAIQYDGRNHDDVMRFTGKSLCAIDDDDNSIVIHTLEGDMRASVRDWIIKGVKDEFYPCKPDIFEATYETEME